METKISIHESGHAMMCYLNKIPFEFIELTPENENRKGQVGGIKTNTELIMRAQVAMAGSIAERIHSGAIQQDAKLGFRVNHNDGKNLNAILATIIEDKDEIMLLNSWLFVRTVHQLQKRWPMVIAVAQELEKRKRLSYKDFQMILLKFVR